MWAPQTQASLYSAAALMLHTQAMQMFLQGHAGAHFMRCITQKEVSHCSQLTNTDAVGFLSAALQATTLCLCNFALKAGMIVS